jgi:PAS domain S-box-containing protein
MLHPTHPNENTVNSLSFLYASEYLGVLTGLEERVTDANDAFLRMVGFTREEMKAGGIDWKSMTPRKYTALDTRGLEELRTRGGFVPYEKEFVLRDGTRLPILLGAVRLSSEPLEWVCWVVDLRGTKEIAQAEGQSRELQLRLDEELKGAYQIHEISTRLLRKSSVEEVLNEILDAAIEVTEADLGNIQLVDQGSLRVVTHRGCSPEFLDFFERVSHETTATCAAALVRRSRVIVEDVSSDPLFRGTAAGEVLSRDGIRAVQSTPLIGPSGELYGMLSTHFHRSRRPDERALRYLDLLANQAGQVLEALHYAEIDRRSERLRAAAELAASMAHEINNPLQALMNVCVLLSQDGAVQPAGQMLVQTAKEQVGRLSETVKKLLAVDFQNGPRLNRELTNLVEHMPIAGNGRTQPETHDEVNRHAVKEKRR